MLRRLSVPGLVVLATVACNSQSSKSGPAVAKGDGIVVTAEEFKTQLNQQNAFMRSRFSTLERKKEYLDTVIRFELLAREAEREGLKNDPEVQLQLKKLMVQKLLQKKFQDTSASGQADVSDAEAQAYYDQHLSDFNKPKKFRAAAILLLAPTGSPDRAKKADLARKALAKVKATEKTNPAAFVQAVGEFSEDPATKGLMGDLGFRSQDELEKAYSKELAAAVVALQPNQTSGVVETPQGFAIVRLTAVQPEFNRTFDQVKAQIANKLVREKKTKEFDEWLKKLRADANIKVDDKALEAVEVSTEPNPGMPGMPAGHGGMGGPMVVPSAPPATPGGHP